MPNPQNVPHITNGVLLVVLVAAAVLLLGLPVEAVLSVADNPVSRVAVVAFTLALVGTAALGFAIHILLHRHKRMETELADMRKLVESQAARTTALTATADGLEARVEQALARLEEEMADERERMRQQVRTYVRGAEQAHQALQTQAAGRSTRSSPGPAPSSKGAREPQDPEDTADGARDPAHGKNGATTTGATGFRRFEEADE